MVTNTTVPRNTKQLVAGVGVLLAAHPTVVRPMIDAIDNLTAELITLLADRADEKSPEKDFLGSAGVRPNLACISQSCALLVYY